MKPEHYSNKFCSYVTFSIMGSLFCQNLHHQSHASSDTHGNLKTMLAKKQQKKAYLQETHHHRMHLSQSFSFFLIFIP